MVWNRWFHGHWASPTRTVSVWWWSLTSMLPETARDITSPSRRQKETPRGALALVWLNPLETQLKHNETCSVLGAPGSRWRGCRSLPPLRLRSFICWKALRTAATQPGLDL